MTTPPAPPPAWWRIAWYPLAVPIAFIVLIWSATEIHPLWLVRPILVTTVVVLAVTFALSAIVRDRDRGGLTAFALAVAFVVDDLRLSALLFFLVWLLVAEGVMNWGTPWRRGPLVTRALTIGGASILLVTIVGTVQNGTFRGAIADIQADMARPKPAASFDRSAPDMYVILLDGYPGDDAAELAPEFDADAFPAELTSRSFEVQRNARSNYLLTRLTVATMFGGEHVVDAEVLDPPHTSLADDSRRLRQFGDGGPIGRALAAAGYETATIASDASHLGLHRVDHAIDVAGINEFEGAVLRSSSSGTILVRLLADQLLDLRRSSVLHAFDAGGSLEPADGRPHFEWIHVMAPHPPAVFDRDGRPVNDAAALSWQEPTSGQAGRAERIRRTFDYVAFVDGQTLELVDRLIERDPASVIVVMSDHGTDTAFNANDPLGSDLDERSSILLAIRAPGRSGLLPAGTTPINVLPRILNAYLGTSLPLRSDTIWAWPTGGSVLDAIPVDRTAFER